MVSYYSPLVLCLDSLYIVCSVSAQGPLVAVGLLVVVVGQYTTPSFIRILAVSGPFLWLSSL